MTPLETAMLLAKSSGRISRDPKTGLFLVGDVALTLAAYEAGMRVLDLREKAATTRTTR